MSLILAVTIGELCRNHGLTMDITPVRRPKIALKLSQATTQEKLVFDELIERLKGFATSDMFDISVQRLDEENLAWVTFRWMDRYFRGTSFEFPLSSEGIGPQILKKYSEQRRQKNTDEDSVDGTLNTLAYAWQSVRSAIQRSMFRLPLAYQDMSTNELRSCLYLRAVLALPKFLRRTPRQNQFWQEVARGAISLTYESLTRMPSNIQSELDLGSRMNALISILETDILGMETRHVVDRFRILLAPHDLPQVKQSMERLGRIAKPDLAPSTRTGVELIDSGDLASWLSGAGLGGELRVSDVPEICPETWDEPVRLLRADDEWWMIPGTPSMNAFIRAFAHGLLMTGSAK